MARIAGVDLPKNKRGVIGLTYIYGIGRSSSAKILGELGIDESLPIPTYYSLPFSCLVPVRHDNLIAVGRMINADIFSFGALRVMVNLNQLGEAAGVAAYLSISSGVSVRSLDGRSVARKLSEGGSANLA